MYTFMSHLINRFVTGNDRKVRQETRKAREKHRREHASPTAHWKSLCDIARQKRQGGRSLEAKKSPISEDRWKKHGQAAQVMATTPFVTTKAFLHFYLPVTSAYTVCSGLARLSKCFLLYRSSYA